MKIYIYCNTSYKLCVVTAWVILHADLSAREEFVADVLQSAAPRCFALLILLKLACFGVPQPADSVHLLLLAVTVLLLLLFWSFVLDPPLGFPVTPDVNKFISSEERLAVFPI